MAQTFNAQLRFLVLDDVINSFDLEHRGELASLLADKFDDWQLVVLTHDRSSSITWCAARPRGGGSRSRPGATSGARAHQATGPPASWRRRRSGSPRGRVGGATRVRRALEELLQEVCEALQAALPFRRGALNDQREIGELLRGVRAR
jgi:hypothetical protein